MKTVFVVGAGASKDISGKMPLGSELALAIEQLLANDLRSRTDGPITTALMRDGGFFDHHSIAMARIRDGIQSRDSIDDFISEWSDVKDIERVAKLSIAYLILEAERASALWQISKDIPNAADGLRKLQNSWIGVLGRHLNPQCRRRDLEQVYANAAFITFNYDRSIQQYLLARFMSTFNRSREDAHKIVRGIPVLHAYGSLGSITDDNCFVEYGGADWSIGAAASNIRTYTEEFESEQVKAIRNLVQEAEKLIFLGCAYHQQNLDLLFGESRSQVQADIWGTSYGMSGRTLRAAQLALNEVSLNVVLHPEQSGEFLSRHEEQLF